MAQDSPSNNRDKTVGRGPGGRFARGNKIGRGIPSGSKHRATIAAEALLTKDGDVKAITATIIREARAGAPWAARLWASVVCPAPRGRLVSFPMPRISSPSDLPVVLVTLMQQVASGQLTPEEVGHIAQVVDCLRASFELDRIAAEIEGLKAQVAQLQIEPPPGGTLPSSKWAA
jgi:hypothetical protein